MRCRQHASNTCNNVLHRLAVYDRVLWVAEKRDHGVTWSDRALNPGLQNMSIINHISENAGVALSLYTCIRKEPSSNLGREICYHDWPFVRLSSFPSGKFRRQYLASTATASFQIRSNLSFITDSMTRHCRVFDNGTDVKQSTPQRITHIQGWTRNVTIQADGA